MARRTWRRTDFRERFSDATVFEQLRTDPYYRTVAVRHPRVAGRVADWIEESSRRRVAMVHGDWSPKNLLVGPRGLVCIDFECAHFGDPSYDAGFMLNHLILKSFRRPDLAGGYLRLARTAFAWTLGMLPADALDWYESATARHLAFLLLARIDGKSPAEYLRSESVRDAARRLALRLIDEAPCTLEDLLRSAEAALPEPARPPTRRP
jgi:aminoglycoside phosphotransferase (APT) family kinase protein